ncbi:Sm-like protein LSM8 [Zea mays]|uniref:Sm-like protein LSM8 n=1 Tax=Zea mays TaxID=4577 RepID=A0A1D6MBT7_MAIZE|nr:Sm-like protein LSM8 [Zea mays]
MRSNLAGWIGLGRGGGEGRGDIRRGCGRARSHLLWRRGRASGDVVHRLGPLVEACEQIAGEGGGERGEDRLCRLYTDQGIGRASFFSQG